MNKNLMISKTKNKGYITIEFTLIFMLLISISAIIFDYGIFLYSKSAILKTVEMFKLDMNIFISQSPSEYINQQEKLYSSNITKDIRNSRSILDEWGIGIDDSKLESNSKQYFIKSLGRNIERIDRFKISRKGVLNREWNLNYKFKVRSLFSELSALEKYRFVEGEIKFKSQNIYQDMNNIDLTIESLQRVKLVQDFIKNTKSIIGKVSELNY